MAGSFRILFMLEDITSLSYVTPKTVWCPTNFRTQASCILVHQKTSKVRYKNKVGIFGHTPVHFPLLWHISGGQTASVVSIKIKKHGTQRRFFYHTIHHDPPWLIKWCICVFIAWWWVAVAMAAAKSLHLHHVAQAFTCISKGFTNSLLIRSIVCLICPEAMARIVEDKIQISRQVCGQCFILCGIKVVPLRREKIKMNTSQSLVAIH